jgi:hypothetical protein
MDKFETELTAHLKKGLSSEGVFEEYRKQKSLHDAIDEVQENIRDHRKGACATEVPVPVCDESLYDEQMKEDVNPHQPLGCDETDDRTKSIRLGCAINNLPEVLDHLDNLLQDIYHNGEVIDRSPSDSIIVESLLCVLDNGFRKVDQYRADAIAKINQIHDLLF